MINVAIQNKLEESLLAETKSVLAVVSHWMAIPLFLLFWIADIIYVPQFKVEFLCLRLLIIPICLLSYNLVKSAKSFVVAQSITSFFMISLASVINIMIYMIGKTDTGYYAGLNLVAIAALSFIPLAKRFWTLTFVGIYGPYLAMMIRDIDNIEVLKQSFVNVFFITGSIVICFLIRLFNNKLRTNEFNAKIELENELKSRELIIKQKTEEATKLHLLSSQFSPQVVKAIKEGQISIEEGVVRSKICAIFIDIVKSTDKVTKLPEKDIQISLAKFLDSCLTTFLKYDLTIDKFHGDGVLAYSNMPIQRTDYIERTCLAALEAVESIKNDKEFYLNHWQSEMQVRVGIATGFANVGFYGAKKYFKTFTAIGAPLPYASRLTSIANPNQILVDSEIAEHLNKYGFITKSCGQKNLKGFEDIQNQVFELIEAPNLNVSNGDAKTCPNHPNSVLYLDTNQDGHFVFKCRDCDFADEQNLNEKTLIAS